MVSERLRVFDMFLVTGICAFNTTSGFAMWNRALRPRHSVGIVDDKPARPQPLKEWFSLLPLSLPPRLLS